MKPLLKFRIAAFVAVLAIGGASVTNLVADFMRPPSSPFPGIGSIAPAQSQVDSANWGAQFAPFRTDLKSDFALAIATQALNGETSYYKPEINQDAQTAARRALLAGPHDSRIWLILALLRNARSLRDPQVTELLKMSYFTGPNLTELVPRRLQTVITNAALNDPDMQDLARGDVRLILTRRPDLKNAITEAYRAGSSASKTFIEDSVKAIDPSFAASLTGGK
jgi:hypothetical protein